ncbi:MAG: GDYXXLXY domain-containing protein [Pseudomonadota bacterium]
MSHYRLRVLFSLLLPLAILAGLVASKQLTREWGTAVRLSISGYDPRDLLSGHYLIYRIDYGVPVCGSGPAATQSDVSRQVPAHICLVPRHFEYGTPVASRCSLAIPGHCQAGRFQAGLERFYIPQEYASPLEQAVRDKKAEILVSVTPTPGAAVVKDLLIGGRPWREVVTPDSQPSRSFWEF